MKKNKANKEKKWERSDVLSVLAIIISIVSIGICLTQTSIQRRQLESQLKENQPIFKLSEETQEFNDSLYLNVISIKNVGKEIKSKNILGKVFFMRLTVSKNDDEESFYIPLSDIYFVNDIQDGYELFNLTHEFPYKYNFYQECKEKSTSSVRYFSSLLIFIIISYTDIYGEYHIEYFEGLHNCSKEYFQGVFKKSRDVFGPIYYDIDDLKLDDILKHIKDKQKK